MRTSVSVTELEQCAFWLGVSHEPSKGLNLAQSTCTPHCSLASSIPCATKRKMPLLSTLPSSELSLSCRVPTEGGPSSHSCSLSPVPLLATLPSLLLPVAATGSW